MPGKAFADVVEVEDGPLPPHSRVFQRTVVVLACGRLLSHPRLDLGHGGLLQLVDDVEWVVAIANPAGALTADAPTPTRREGSRSALQIVHML